MNSFKALPLAAILALLTPCVPSRADCPSAPSGAPVSVQTTSELKSVVDAIPIIGLRLPIGSFTGIEPSVQLTKNKNVNVALEGFAGVTGLSPGYGGGARVEFRTNGEKNFFVVAPGIDAYVSPPDSSFLGHSDDQLYVVPNVDVKWLHQFASRFGLELGLRAGYGIATDVEKGGTRSSPTVQLITGLRF